MPLTPPPDDLTRFPRRRTSPSVRTLYRIFRERNQDTGEKNSPWHFSTITIGSTGRNRFDVPQPNGTCYWSSQRYGAWVEVFQGCTRVDRADALLRRICTGQAPSLRLANLLSPKAGHFGITAAISTQPNYLLPQQWAEALRLRGFDGLVGTCSHDPSSKALNVAVFGEADTQSSQPPWTTSSTRLDQDTTLGIELAKLGVSIERVPYDVQTTTPPP
jgi:hypothetical protein